MTANDDALAFTGERFTPECVREIWYEHWHRYAFALPLARGKRVLDAACGEGYGSAMLADVAAHVIGVDIAEEAVMHARARYGSRANLDFGIGDATALEDLPDAAFDLVCSFETLEHVHRQEELIAGFARVLAPGGVLLVSSPDKAEYSDARGFANEFHVRELYRAEFEALLARHFAQHRLFGQKLLFQSALWSLDRLDRAAAVTADGEVMRAGLHYRPLYFVAACSQQALPAMPDVDLFGDAGESVYAHYNGEIRKNMAAGARIAELERRVAELESSREPKRPWWRRLFR